MSLVISHLGRLILPSKTAVDHQTYLVFLLTGKSQRKLKFSHVDLTSTRLGKGKTLPTASMYFLAVFPPSRTALGEFGLFVLGCGTLLYTVDIFFPMIFL